MARLTLLVVLITAYRTSGLVTLRPNSPEVLDLIGGQVRAGWTGNVTLWPGDPVTNPEFMFPELSDGPYGIPALQAKASFGIGVSGGGLRSFTLAMGWLRGLHSINVLERARYLGSASGGSMANIMLTYTDYDKWEKRFGKYIPPGQLNNKALRAAPKSGTFLSIINDMPNFYQTSIENLVRGEAFPTAGGYARSISEAILLPLGLHWFNSTVAALGTRGSVHERIEAIAAQQRAKVYYAMSNPKQPFPLITGNVLDFDTPLVFFPIEFTPLYIGSPGNYRQYQQPGDPIGPGLMEPLAFNAKALSPPREGPLPGTQTMEMKSTYMVPLVSHVAVSGGIMAVELDRYIHAKPRNGTIRSLAAGQPFFDYLDFQEYTADSYPFGDGGYIDNEGLWAMLRRKTKKIIIFYASLSDATDKQQWSSDQSGLSLAFGACHDCYTYLNTSTDLANEAAKVFDTSHFDDFFNTVQANNKAGVINVWNATLDVLENKFMGVPGGWKVDLMIVMSSKISLWEEKLHKEGRAMLEYSRSAAAMAKSLTNQLTTHQLVSFPFPDIGIFRYTPPMLHALSNMATWSVLQLEDRIKAFLEQ